MTWGRWLRVLVSPDKTVAPFTSPVEITDQPLSIGRQPKMGGLTIADSKLSRSHIVVVANPSGDIVIRDLNSTNGTTVNRLKIHKSITIGSDAIVRIGDTVLHVGHSLKSACRPKGTLDILLDLLAQEHSRHDYPMLIKAAVGSGVRRLTYENHQRARRKGAIVLLAENTWDKTAPWHNVPKAAQGTLLLMSAQDLTPSSVQRLLHVGREHACRVILSTTQSWDGLQTVAPDAVSVEIPPISTRRAAVWALTLAQMTQFLGQTPTFSRGAIVTWLCAPFPQGWRDIATRTQQLINQHQDNTVIRTNDVRQLLKSPSGQKPCGL